MTIAITGATGSLGRLVINQLRTARHGSTIGYSRAHIPLEPCSPAVPIWRFEIPVTAGTLIPKTPVENSSAPAKWCIPA